MRGCGVVVRLDKFQRHFAKMHPASIDSCDKHLAVALSKAQLVHAGDFTHCPECGLRLLKDTLAGHMKTSCEKLGKGRATTPPWKGSSYDDHWNPW